MLAIPLALAATVVGQEAKTENGPRGQWRRERENWAVLYLTGVEVVFFIAVHMVLCLKC